MFFKSWQLWEKMTFVSTQITVYVLVPDYLQILALAISCVFVVGWAQVVWRIRSEKKQEIVDEEKRSRIQDLRKSGLILDSHKKQEIPFGVRAIQSGIQVDGIWISGPNTPVPSELTLANLPGESSDDSAKRCQSPQDELLGGSRTKSKVRVWSIGRPEGIGNRRPAEILQEISERNTIRSSYKPRRSSQLRFSGHGAYDEETLEQLEGTPISKKKTHSPRPRGSQQIDADADSSAADNERNSGTSDDSDATLSQEPSESDQLAANNTKIITDIRGSRLSGGTLIKSEAATGYPLNPSMQIFATSENKSGIEGSSTTQTQGEHDRLTLTNQSKRAGPPKDTSVIPFVPGELHMNKVSRRVNPGFEVLPAGTFGAPSEFNLQLENFDAFENVSHKKPAAKLQKKPRTSISGPTSTVEVP